MKLRQMHFGQEDLVAHAKQKRFKFGNGETKMAESFIELPQTLAGQSIRLGVHTLDAPGVPLLISVKTLTRLRAIVDFEDATICFKQMSTERWLPLKRARNGHLLLDLIQDWLGDVKSIHLASDPATASNDFPDMPREQYKAADQSICGDQHTFLPSPCHGIREVDPHAHSSFAGDSKVSQVVSADSRCVCEEDMEKELMSEQCHEQQFGNERMQSANPNADFTTGSSMRLFPALVAAAISSTSASTRHVLKPNRPYPRMRRPKLPWPSRRPSRNPRALATEHRRPRSTIGLECKAQIPEILGARDTPAGAH
jgi:hypothetical protein